MSHLKSLVILLTFFSTLIFANDEIVITADRIESSFGDTTSKIEIINQKNIETIKSNNLEEALEKYSDFNVVKGGQIGNTASVFIRGMEASHTLVLLDGIILNDPSNPSRQFDFSKINLNNIEKIELLKGSQGLLYGSNAIGGVVLLTSKKTKRDELSSTLAYGSHQSANINFNVNKIVNSNDLMNFGFQLFNSKGFSSAKDNTQINDLDGIKKGSINWGYNGHFLNNINFDLRTNYLYEVIDLDKGGGPNSDDPNFKSKNQNLFSKISLEKIINEKLSSKFQYSYTDYLRRSFDQTNVGQTYDGSSFYKGKTHNIEIENTYYFNDFLVSQLNVAENIEKDLINENSNTSLFLYNRFEYGPALVNAGLRFDYNKIFKDAFTYKLGLGHKFNWFDLHTSFSTGFRAPSLNQLFDATYGNRNLRPEKSKSVDLGIIYKANRFSLDSTIFYNHLDDRLTYHPTTFLNINAGKSYSKGIEEAINISLTENLTQITKYVLTESFNLANGKRLARRPESLLTHSYHLSLEKFNFDTFLKFKSSTTDVDNNGNDTKNKKFITCNIVIDYLISSMSSASVSIDNLFNSDYEEIWGYNNGGRIINLRYKMTF